MRVSSESLLKQASDSVANKFLVFRLGNEEHAVPLLSVREVSSMRPLRRVPETPHYHLGVTNLRGNVVSVISLCAKIGVDPIGPDSNKAMLVFDLSGTTLGVVVDEVLSVCAISSNEIDRETHVNLPISSRYLLGIAKISDRLVTLIDLTTLLEGAVVQNDE